MPQSNPLSSLQTLLRLKTPTHVDANADPYVIRRRGEMASGIDDMLPEADAPGYKLQQAQDGARFGVSLPRADYRSSDLSVLRQKLGLGQIAHERELEQADVRGQYDVAGQVAGQQAAMDRLLASQGSINSRAEADRSARADALEARLKAQEDLQTSRDAAAMDRTQFSRNTPQARPEAGGLMGLWRMLMGGGQEEAAAPEQAPVSTTPQRRILSVR